MEREEDYDLQEKREGVPIGTPEGRWKIEDMLQQRRTFLPRTGKQKPGRRAEKTQEKPSLPDTYAFSGLTSLS